MTVIASSCSAYAPAPTIVPTVRPSTSAAPIHRGTRALLHRIDRRVERVEQQQPEGQRREQRLHVLQEKDRDAERNDDKRRRADVEPLEERRLGASASPTPPQRWVSTIYVAKSCRSRSRRWVESAIHVPWTLLCTCAGLAWRPSRLHTCCLVGAPHCACDATFAGECPAAGERACTSIPKRRRQIGVRTAWAKVRQIVFAWWVWGIAAIMALVYDNWGWAIGTGLMSAFAFLVWPREVPPRVGLDHEFSVDDDEFLTTIAGSTGIPFFEGNAIEILNNGDEFYPAMLKAIAQAQMLRSRSKPTFTGPATSASASRRRSRRAQRRASASRFCSTRSARRPSATRFSKFSRRAVASSHGTTPRAPTASGASITGRIASR